MSEAIIGAGEFHAGDSPALEAMRQRLPHFLGVDYSIAGLVRPADSGELATAVRAAGEQGLAILRIYNSSNVGARLSGGGPALIIDLSRMNRILEVDVDNGTVLVEPAVSYRQLADHFAGNGQPLLVDSERDPAASIAGSVLSKGLGLTPYGDHLLVQCGGEFVLPSGRLLRTGMGAMEDNRTWQLYKYALGPYADGLAVQSDLMLPARLGLWVMGQVPAFRHFAFDLPDDSALEQALEAIRPLKIANTLPGTVLITHREFDKRRGGPGRDAAWRLQSALYGLPQVVDLTMRAIEAVLNPIGEQVPDSVRVQDRLLQEEEALFAGRPGPGPVVLEAGRPTACISFAAPIEGGHGLAMARLAAAAQERLNEPPAVEFRIVGRSLLANCHFPARSGSALELAEAVASLMAAMGEAGFAVIAQSPEFDHLVGRWLAETGAGGLTARIGEAIGA